MVGRGGELFHDRLWRLQVAGVPPRNYSRTLGGSSLWSVTAFGFRLDVRPDHHTVDALSSRRDRLMADTARNEPVTLLEMIEAEFSFLVELGFRSVVEGDNSVRYERDDGVFVHVFRDPKDKYVGFRVGLASRPRDALTATELARLSGVTAPRGQYPDRPDEVHAGVARVARELREHGQRALAGDESIYDEAMELRRAYTQQFTRDGSTDAAGPGAANNPGYGNPFI